MDYDFLEFSQNHHIISNITRDEPILFSDKIQKINWLSFKQERNIIITDRAIYNLNDTTFKRRIDFKFIKGISVSKISDEFVIHCDDKEYDCQYSSSKKKIILKILASLYHSKLGKDLKLFEINEKSLYFYQTSEREKKKDKNFSRMPKENSITIREYTGDNKLIDFSSSFHEKVPKSQDYIPEKSLHNYSKSMDLESLEIIGKQMRNSICKIYCHDGSVGTGFFCDIAYDKWNSIKALLTNNHVLKADDIVSGKSINFTLNNDKIELKIDIDQLRKTYTNPEYDITIIEIKEKDNLSQESFLEVDKQIFEGTPKSFVKKPVYLLHYPKGEQIKKGEGLIKDIYEDEYSLEHICDSSEGSSGGPIINALNYKVVAIHKGGAQGVKNYNLGTFLRKPFENIKEEMNKSKDNKNEGEICHKNTEKIKGNSSLNDENKDKENKNKFNDEITILYKIDKEQLKKDNEDKKKDDNNNNNNNNENYKFNIFGDNFVKKNKKLCKIILNGQERELCSELELNNITLNKDILEIKLKGMNNINSIYEMFKDCKFLLSLLDISNINIEKFSNLSSIFYGCSSLENLPESLNWNTKNVEYMDFIFFGCSSLKYLPDISEWNTDKVIEMNHIFGYCKKIVKLPDISKWNTKNVTNMKSMFLNCSSITYLPDISQWNVSKVTDMSFLFAECYSLKSLPDISNWDIRNVGNIKGIFDQCYSLDSLPNISKWDTKKIKSFESIFYQCKLLESLPDISKWETKNVTSMLSTFDGCKNLEKLPDISKWNTKNVTTMKCMFQGCESLESLPDISIWKIYNVNSLKRMFYNCKSLQSLPDISKWDGSKVKKINGMIHGCNSLNPKPDVQLWNFKKIKNINCVYEEYTGRKCTIF